MLIRLLTVLALVFTLSACSSTKDQEGEQVPVSQREDMTGGPLGGTEYTQDGMGAGAMPGTQQDLVVNVGDRVFFGYDRYDVSAEAQEILKRQADWLRQYPNVSVTIEGHCDERGTREYNLALGERRATAVKNYLVALGIEASRVNTISYGKEQPAVLGSNEESWAQNRRGVTRVD